MKIYLVRHASTNFNEAGNVNSQYDDMLSENGKKQLTPLVKRMQDLDFDKIYSSTLKRAIDTAKPVSDYRKIEIITDARLNEVDFGNLTGKSSDQMVSIFGKTASELLDSYDYDFTKYGGESATQVKERVLDFLNDLKKENEDVAIFTHSGVIRWTHYLLEKNRVKSFPNTSIYEFNID